MVRWDRVQPRAGERAAWSLPDRGCVRDRGPCAAYAGVREQLRAVRSQQRAGGGFEVLVVLTGLPAWAGSREPGCEPPGTPAPRAIAPAALPAYRALVASLLDLARREGVALRWWSAWNEPNLSAFLAPQRARCDVTAPTLAPARYAAVVRALRAQLEAEPGEQQLVLGELAGLERGRPRATGAAEFIDALPADVACAGPVWSQHAYVGGEHGDRRRVPGDPSGVASLLREVERALDRRGCAPAPRIWITETGVGGAKAGAPRSPDAASLRAGCRDLQATLAGWLADSRIDAAFQYTFREDDRFPVGLVDTGLTRAYPTLDVWRAWAGGRGRDEGPPALPAGCA